MSLGEVPARLVDSQNAGESMCNHDNPESGIDLGNVILLTIGTLHMYP